MLSPKCTLSCVVSKPDYRYIYAIGGFNGEPLAEVERYDVTQEEWVKISQSMLQRRFMHSTLMVSM